MEMDNNQMTENSNPVAAGRNLGKMEALPDEMIQHIFTFMTDLDDAWRLYHVAKDESHPFRRLSFEGVRYLSFCGDNYYSCLDDENERRWSQEQALQNHMTVVWKKAIHLSSLQFGNVPMPPALLSTILTASLEYPRKIKRICATKIRESDSDSEDSFTAGSDTNFLTGLVPSCSDSLVHFCYSARIPETEDSDDKELCLVKEAGLWNAISQCPHLRRVSFKFHVMHK